MLFSSALIFGIAAVNAATMSVTAAVAAAFFTPEVLMATVHDVVEFRFKRRNCGVTTGTLDVPCAVGAVSDFSSGVVSVQERGGVMVPVFRGPINTTAPTVSYCTQAALCQAEMTGVINGDTSLLVAYKMAAKKATHAVVPAGVFGGALGTSTGKASSLVEDVSFSEAVRTVKKKSVSGTQHLVMIPPVAAGVAQDVLAKTLAAVASPAASLSTSGTDHIVSTYVLPIICTAIGIGGILCFLHVFVGILRSEDFKNSALARTSRD